MRSLFALWAFVLATPGETSHIFSSPTVKNGKVTDELPDDAEMLPPMEPYESVDLDVDEEADREGTFPQHPPHSHPVLVHPAGPGGEHSRKTHDKPKAKKVGTTIAKKEPTYDPKKDPNPMNTLHQNMKPFHNNGVRNFEKVVDSAAVDQSAGTHGKPPEVPGRHPEVQVQHRPSRPQAPKPQKPEPVVQHVASPTKPATVSPASPVSHEVSHTKDKAAEARDTVAPDAPMPKATMEDKLSQALAPPKAPTPMPESDVLYEPVHHKGSGKHTKKHKVQDSSMKKVVTQTTAAPTTTQEAQKHADLQSQVAELDADLEDTKRIAPIPANVEANLESKLDTEDKQKATDKAADKSSEQIEPPKMKQHGKHKHSKGKKKAEATAQQIPTAPHEDPLDQLHSDAHLLVHPEAAQPEVVQVTPKPQVTEAEAETKENGSDKLQSDTSGETVVSISKKLAKAVESKLENALQPPVKPQPVEKEVAPPEHHSHGKKHKKHSQHQDATPAWSHNSTNGDAIKALHRDTHQVRANVNKSQGKPAPSAAPVKAAEVAHIAPEEKLQKDLGMSSGPETATPVAKAVVPPPAVHTLVHKTHKHHKGKSKFVVGNVTYKDPMAAVHHDAAAVSGKVNLAPNKTQSASIKNAPNKSIAPLAKLDKDLGVNASDAQKSSDAKKKGQQHTGKHHNFLKKKKQEKKTELPTESTAPTEKPPYNVSLMHHALEHLDHAIESQERSYMAATGRIRIKPNVVDEDRPEGYPTS
eukprot:gnl/MRDRNA2_/MRDRNA2_96838_c0_seq1.p1 gnl/MRDRNA2_/MRDRNA2_96838_c0~~gnl/MRDRNA2_/MRDRNA2_96838_c0_seq1.p1  ORF type:complete len:753 (+),score=195.24 gnl/MRDRNA2_/MRDRNA2_96838_c0_seq1:110-2368(+)